MKTAVFRFAAGALVGGIFVAMLLLLDIGGFGRVVTHEPASMLVLLMLVLQIGGMFGIAVLVSPSGSEEEPHGQPSQFNPALAARRPRSPNR
jgi:hypothetical protein